MCYDYQVMNIQIPLICDELDQDEEYILFDEGEFRKRIQLHDYRTIYSIPGLYEKVLYEMLKCKSPSIVASLLAEEVKKSGEDISSLNVLDLGAGNGIVAEELRNFGVDKIVGVDIIKEAKDAAYRDRPDVYEEYFVADLGDVDPEIETKVGEYEINCLTSVAALGFGDIPPLTLANAINLEKENSWLALTVKEDFLSESDTSGMNRLFTILIDEKMIDVKARKSYVHRNSLSGTSITYDAFIAKINRKIPDEILQRL